MSSKTSEASRKASLLQLDRACEKVARQYPAGTFWQHSVKGTVYEVTGSGVREHDTAIVVYFRPVNELRFVNFNRPAAEWEEMVDVDGKMEPRFFQVQKVIVYQRQD